MSHRQSPVPDSSGRRRHRAVAMLAALLLPFTVPLSAQDKEGGPVSLFLTYRCTAEKRPAFRAHIEGAGVSRFEKWKEAGVFKDYLILMSSYPDSQNWDAMVRLDFERYTDTKNWKEIERTMPSGLSTEGLALCSPATAYLADLTWEKASPSRDLSKAVYKTIPYQWAKDKERYRMLFEAGKKLELDNWVDAGIVSWYGVYINQLPAGDPWDVIFLLEYRDLAALGDKEQAKLRGRSAKLQDNPGFWFARQAAAGSRDMQEIVIADPVLPGRPASTTPLATDGSR